MQARYHWHCALAEPLMHPLYSLQGTNLQQIPAMYRRVTTPNTLPRFLFVVAAAAAAADTLPGTQNGKARPGMGRNSYPSYAGTYRESGTLASERGKGGSGYLGNFSKLTAGPLLVPFAGPGLTYQLACHRRVRSVSGLLPVISLYDGIAIHPLILPSCFCPRALSSTVGCRMCSPLHLAIGIT